jgi:hypothetical protein
VERERGLVAVMAVRDQELSVGELLDERVGELLVQPPEPRHHSSFVGLQLGLAEAVDLDRAVPEEEERLELRAGRTQQPQPPLLRPGMRALVRQDDPVLVRLEQKRRDEPFAAPRDAVRADVLLHEPPARGLRIANEDSLLLPLHEACGRILLGVGQRQVNDVVRA